MAFTAAVKEAFSLKLAIAGIAGVGKSYTSFQIARELANGERFAVIDTENRKSRKYADEFQFDASDLEIFSIEAYTKEVKVAEAAGYKVLVIDGLSQMWEGKGGIKEMVDMIAKRDRTSSFNAWSSGNAMLAEFIKMILESPMHIICTMRSKTDYSSETNDKGKLQYRRIGLAPIQKDNLEFEFDLFAEMDHEHNMIFQKSLCRKLSGKVLPMDQEGEIKKLAVLLKKWMEGEHITREARQSAPAASTQASLNKANEIAARAAKCDKIRSMTDALVLKCPPLDKLDEAALDNLIAQYKAENAQRRTSARAETAARAEMAKG